MKASTSSAATTAPAHNAPLPPTASSAGRSSRIAPHSHIKGLGVSPEGYANLDGAGFIGQTNAREVCHALLSFVFGFGFGFCFRQLTLIAIKGMWRRRRSDQVEKILWKGTLARGCSRDWENCAGVGSVT
jgi:hypothetical protein